MSRFATVTTTLLVSAALLAGCGTSHLARLTADNCIRGNANASNVIEVYLDDSNRRPVAVPEVCHVRGGSKIVWVQRKDPTKRILVAFDKGCGSPERRGNGTFTGEFDNRKNEHVATLGETRQFDAEHKRCEGSYKYSVSIGGIKSDPSIIIDPN